MEKRTSWRRREKNAVREEETVLNACACTGEINAVLSTTYAFFVFIHHNILFSLLATIWFGRYSKNIRNV